jgi:hypothetical protein
LLSLWAGHSDGLHRKPIAFVFGPDFAPLFIAANKRAATARDGRARDRWAIPCRNDPMALDG